MHRLISFILLLILRKGHIKSKISPNHPHDFFNILTYMFLVICVREYYDKNGILVTEGFTFALFTPEYIVNPFSCH